MRKRLTKAISKLTDSMCSTGCPYCGSPHTTGYWSPKAGPARRCMNPGCGASFPPEMASLPAIINMVGFVCQCGGQIEYHPKEGIHCTECGVGISDWPGTLNAIMAGKVYISYPED